MSTAADPQIVPRQPASLPALRAADHGVADSLESVLSDNTQPRLRRPVAFVQRLVWRCWPPLPAGGAPHRWPATWPPAPVTAPASPPCAWPRPPSPRRMNGPATNLPARIVGYAPR